MKKKILVYADSPTVKTGFGTVSRNILANLYRTGKYDIDIFGINYHGTPHELPYRIWPAADGQAGDPYGRKKFCYFCMQHDFDILFVIQDTFITDFIPELVQHLKQNRQKPFKTVMYYPVDSVIKPAWAKNIEPVDQLVCYTEFGKQETLKNINKEIEVVYHGVNCNDFHPLPKADVEAFRKNYFGNLADKFIFMNVNRNQQRKDIPRTMQAFTEFRKQRPDSILYLHMAKKDQGWDLVELCGQFDLDPTKDVVFPENFEPNQAYPIEILNMLYNCADCIISTTLGEGFGLGWVEAMACMKPTISPRNTAMKELIAEDMGYLVDSGSEASLWTCIPHDNEIMRPLVDVDDMVHKMLSVYDDYDAAKEKAAKAYQWVTKELPWEGKIADSWKKIFEEAGKVSMQPEAPKVKGPVISTEEF